MAESVGQATLGVVDLHIRQGSDCAFALEYAQVDANGTVLSVSYDGWEARSQIRRKVGGDVWLDLGPLLTLTHADGVLSVTGFIPAAVTEDTAWNARASRVDTAGEAVPSGVWDIELVTPTGGVVPFVEGAVFVDPDVTREA